MKQTAEQYIAGLDEHLPDEPSDAARVALLKTILAKLEAMEYQIETAEIRNPGAGRPHPWFATDFAIARDGIKDRIAKFSKPPTLIEEWNRHRSGQWTMA